MMGPKTESRSVMRGCKKNDGTRCDGGSETDSEDGTNGRLGSVKQQLPRAGDDALPPLFDKARVLKRMALALSFRLPVSVFSRLGTAYSTLRVHAVQLLSGA